MPHAGESIRFELKAKKGQSIRLAVLTMAKGMLHGQLAWKAVVRVEGERARQFGTLRSSMLATTQHLMGRFADRIANGELARVEEAVADMQTRHDGSQPRIRGDRPRNMLAIDRATPVRFLRTSNTCCISRRHAYAAAA